MTRNETKAVLAAIMATFPNWKPPSLETAINTWHMVLADYDYTAINAALKAYIMTDTKGFPPSIGQLIDKIPTSGSQLSALEAWGMVYRCIQSSIYHAKENFDGLPPVVQKAVGSPDVLREWAMSDVESITVIQANFVRAYNAVAEKQRELAKIPASVQQVLEESSAKMLQQGNADDIRERRMEIQEID